MKKLTIGLGFILASALLFGTAFATGPTVNDHTCQGNADCSTTINNAGGSSTSTNTNKNVNKNMNTNKNVNKQSQGQAQSQSQKQGQAQGQAQNNDQTIAPSQSMSYRGGDVPYQAPAVSAPGLTAAGTGVCLGSVSVGASALMAGATFGITKVDPGCEARSGSALLMQYSERSRLAGRQEAFERASLRVLAGESLKDALTAEGLAPQSEKKVASEPTQGAKNVEVVVGEQQVLSRDEQPGASVQSN